MQRSLTPQQPVRARAARPVARVGDRFEADCARHAIGLADFQREQEVPHLQFDREDRFGEAEAADRGVAQVDAP